MWQGLKQWLARRRQQRARSAYYGDCPDCRHDWREHDPTEGCGECRYEIEHEDSDAPEHVCRTKAAGWTS